MAQGQRLGDHQFTFGLTPAQVETLTSMATEVRFAEDEVILLDSQRSEYFYLLVSGSVAVELCTPAYAICVQALGPGEVFGWSALLDHHDTVFRVRARERTTALRIGGAELAGLCRTDSQLGIEVLLRTLQVVARRVRATEERFAEMWGVRPQAAGI